MKNLHYFSKSRLLFTLIALFMGISSSWAQDTVNEGFEDWTTDGVANGWLLINNATYGNTYSYDYVVGSSDFTPSSGSKCLANSGHSAAQGTTSSPMIVTPAMTGTFTFKFRKYNSSSSTNGYINIFEYDETTGTATGSSIWTCRPNYTNEATSKYQTANITVGTTAKRYAIYLAKVSIDELSYTSAVVNPYKKPASLTISNITTNSADVSWTSGSSDNSETGWNLEYKKAADETWTEEHGLGKTTLSYSLSNLSDNTLYDVRVKALYANNNESDWNTGSFKTLRAPISTFPWSENFNAITSGIPDGWDNSEGTTTTETYKWNYYATGHDGACVRFNSYSNYTNNTNSLKTPVMTFNQNAPMQLKFWYKNPTGGDFSVYISNDGGATYTTALESCTGLTGASSWTEKVVDLPTDMYYENVVIVFKGTSNYGSGDAYIYLDDVLVKEKSDSEPNLAVTPEEDAAFGTVTAAASKTYTVTNAGTGTLDVNIASNNAMFTVSPSTLDGIAAGESKTFTITFTPIAETYGTFNADITVTPTYDTNAAVTIAASAKVKNPNVWSEDFTGNTLPDGWKITNGTYWKIEDGMAKGSYSYGNYDLITPSLIVETGQSLTFDYRMTSTYRSLDIQYSKDNGEWTSYGTISYSGLTQNQWYTYTISGLEPGSYKFRFSDSNYDLDNFEGFNRNMNDPELSVYTDAQYAIAATTSETKDFGFVEETQTVNYYIKNTGTGNMALRVSNVPDGFTAQLGINENESLGQGEGTALTITMPVDNKGYYAGNIEVTASKSNSLNESEDFATFTVAVSGVMMDENKLNLDFATDNIPSTWTANSWTKNNDGYMEVGYTASTIQTSTLNAAANEQFVVVAKQSYTSSSYTFGVKYREVGTETWNDLIAAANIGTSWVTLAATIETAGAYELQFTGNYTQIKHIYGLTEPNEPVMVVYDGENVAGAAYDFGNVSDEADAVWTLTVKNEGKSVLTGLAATLSGTNDTHYSYEIAGATGTNSDEIQPNATATITVKQLKNNLGDHEATLTISATGLDSKVITLSGTTRDHTKLFVDFDNPNSIPEGWKAGTSWSVYTYGTDRYAQQTNFNTASALVTTPLTVAAIETLKFQAARYYSSSACELKVRYTTDGGVSWSDYVDYSSQIASSSFVNLELTGVPEGTAVVEFYGRYVKLDNISGFAPTTAPMLALTEGNDAVANGDTKAFGNLTEDGVATYTLTNTGNANMVSNVYATGYAEVEISGEGEGVTLEKVNNSETYNKVTLEPGKSATLTLTVKYEAPFTEKNGEMVIETEGWVGDMTVNYTSNSIDPTAVYIDFADGKKPDGFYSNGWTYTSGYAANSNTTTAEFITSKLTVAGEDDIITFDARAAWDGYGEELIVEYSTAENNRAAWTEVKILSESDLTSTFQTFQIKGLDAGDYYLRFSGKRVYVDNIMGWHYTQPAAEHDLYVTSVYPEESILVPGTEITVTADVTSLIADEEGVYTKLYCRNADTSTSEVLVTSTTTEDISKDGTKTFTMTATLPNTEAHYCFSVGAFLSDGTEIMISKRSNLYNLQHTRTMEITEYTRTDGDGALDANANNQISASFSVKVKNTGTAAAFPIVKIKVGDVVVGEATPDLILIPGNESAIDVNLNNISAFEGGELSFVAEAYWNATDAEPKAVSDPIVITVNAVAPKFALYTYPGDTPVNDGDDVDFGLIKQMTAHNYVIKNEGNKDMEFVGITCPEGFSATSILDEGKKIVAANGGYLAFDVYMDYNVGRKNGQLVITYKVDESTNKTFTLNLSGRSVSADTWTEPFDNTYTAIPDNWTNNGWQVASGSSDYPGAAYSYNETATLMTPRLAAAEGEVLTFDVASNSYGFTYAYSTDGGATWSDEINVAAGTTGEQSFTAPAEGNYYLRFTGRYGYLRNFVGFKLSSLGDLTLLDTEDFDDNIELGRYETVTVSRTFNKGWGTVVLPFDVDAATVQAKFGEGTKLYTLSDFNATTGDIQFSPVYNGKIAAGTPYLINIPEAIDNGITFENVTVVADVNDKVLDNGAEFHGNYDAGMSMVDLFGITPEGKIAKGVGSSTMKAYRAYMVLPGNVDPNNARLVIFDETTGISRVLNDVESENTNIYNLNGQRVNKSAKGILLINGKKVMIK